MASSLPLTNSSTEAADWALFEAACREFCIGDNHQDDEHIDVRVSPRSWVNFREDIFTMGEVQLGTDKIIVGENKMLIKQSNRLPICTFPSCCSTDGTSSNEDHRCNKHVGLIKYGAMELEFIAGNTIAWDMTYVVFVHDPNDTELDIKRKMVQEYKRTGLINGTEIRLRKKKLVAAATALRLEDAIVPLKRFWIFSELEQAIAKINTLMMAVMMILVAMAGKRQRSSEKGDNVIPHGFLEGKRVMLVVGSTDVPEDSPDSQREDIETEQRSKFGIVTEMVETQGGPGRSPPNCSQQ